MKHHSYLPLAATLLLVAGCDNSPLALPQSEPLAAQRVNAGTSDITVMTQNLYVGADVDLVIRARGTEDPSDDFPALMFAIETVAKTDFPARAQAIAAEIARQRPHAVGLQEVSDISIDLRPLGVEVVVEQDFLALVQAALAERGLHYTVAATSDNVSVSLVFGLVRLVDHDALLVDADRVTVNSHAGQNFAVNLGEVAEGIVLVRGWVYAHTTIGGQSYTFASAHTEANLAGAPVGQLEQIRAAQVSEMVATLGSSERVILMGDLNDQPGSPMYGVLADAGYVDNWRALRPGVAGLTCCHAADLSDRTADFNQRIDYIWTRGFGRESGNIQGSIDRFGDVPSDRLAGPASLIWPSDHAGLVTSVK